MKNYYQVLDLLKTKLEADPLVQTITNVDEESFDLDKKNIYPIVDILCESAVIGLQTITFTFTITALDIRDINQNPRTDKFVGNDNKQDNLNTTLAILNRLYKSITKFGDDVTIVNEPTPEPRIYQHENLLDGWQMTLELETPNTEISVC
ncbi:hypothetical protein [Flagellimonas onchidii]|uniref:hypothetical protein n=1 Tax=Flagellimonas onchidii TaxID=2562684 RepID=UPI0010A66241|nr:hypothetical protein [Allomuricauda onchidii]